MTGALDGAARPVATTVTVTVGASGDTAKSGADYAEVAEFDLTIDAGATSAAARFTITPTDDGTSEAAEQVTVSATTEAFGLTVEGTALTIGDDDTVSTTVALTLMPISVSEDGGAQAVTVTGTLDAAARPAATTVAVTVGVDSDTAKSGTDYAAVAEFDLTIDADATSGTRTFTITPTDDGTSEGIERVTVSGATDSGLSVTGAELTLADDDTASTSIALSLAPGSVSENGAQDVEVKATLNGGARPAATTVTVSVGASGDTASSGNDYAAVASFDLTIDANATTGTAKFAFTPTNDSVGEGAEAVTVSGTATGFTVTSTQLTLNDDDTASTGIALSLLPTSVTENGGAQEVTVTAMLDAAARPAATTVAVTVGASSDTASSGNDYAAVSSFDLTIDANATSGTAKFSITTTNDLASEGSEAVTVSGTATGLTVTSTQLALSDDDAASTGIALSLVPTSVAENGGPRDVEVTATLDAAARTTPATVAVTVGASGDAATSGDDYAAVSSFELTIDANATSGTGTFALTPTNDALGEGDETVTVSGTTTADGLTVTDTELTLTDDDTVSTGVALRVTPASVSEDAAATAVTVTGTLDGGTLATAATVTVAVGASGDAAAEGTDYATVADFELTIEVNASSGAATFTLTPTADTTSEGDEAVTVSGTATGFTVTDAALTLADDEALPAATLVATPASVSEAGGSSAVTAALSGPSSAAVEVEISVLGSAAPASADDYEAPTGFELTIAAEASSGTASFEITPVADGAAEGGEWLSLLGGTDGLVVSGAALGLADGDRSAAAARLSVRPAAIREDAGATAVTVRAELDGTASATRRVLTVAVGGGTGTAASGEDYAAVAEFGLTIVAGATSGTAAFTLTPTDDGAAEGFETVSVVATGELSAAGARLAIADDDGTPAGALLGVWPAMVREGSGAMAVTVTAALDGAVSSSQRVLTVAVSPVSPGGFALGTARALTIEAGRTASSNTVTMTAVADGHDAPDQVVTVSGAASGGHGTASPVPRLVTVADDDAAALTVGPAMIGVATDDADGDIYTVALATLPSGPVTVRVDGTAGTGLIVTPAQLTFAVNDWSTVQTVRVTAGPAVVADATVTLVHRASGGGYNHVPAATVAVTVTAVPTITIGDVQVPESAPSADFLVRLSFSVPARWSCATGRPMSPPGRARTTPRWTAC